MLVGALFEIGNTSLSDDLRQAVNKHTVSIMQINTLILLHARGHWGEASDSQETANQRAVTEGGVICSHHRLPPLGDLVSIVTSADRGQTVVSLKRAAVPVATPTSTNPVG